jgi:hypothetical protein
MKILTPGTDEFIMSMSRLRCADLFVKIGWYNIPAPGNCYCASVRAVSTTEQLSGAFALSRVETAKDVRMSNTFSPRKVMQIWGTSNGLCWYCGKTAEEIEHVHPKFHGGRNDIDNLVPACKWCNKSKRANDLEAWRGKLSIKLGMSFTPEQRLYWAAKGVELPPDEQYQFYFEKQGWKQ